MPHGDGARAGPVVEGLALARLGGAERVAQATDATGLASAPEVAGAGRLGHDRLLLSQPRERVDERDPDHRRGIRE